MKPFIFQLNGNLGPGIHEITLPDIKIHFGFSTRRRQLIKGLEKALKHLKDCGCRTLFLNGSFSSNCDYPNDYDACYEPAGVNWAKMAQHYPDLLAFKNGRARQKQVYGGEFFVSTTVGAPPRLLYIDLFQRDKNDGSRKGILKIDLTKLQI